MDGFGDLNGSGEICLEEEKKGKAGENRPVGKFDDGLLSAAKESSDWIVKCNESVKSAAMVIGFMLYHFGLRMPVSGIAKEVLFCPHSIRRTWSTINTA